MATFVSIGSGLGIMPWERNRKSECYSAELGTSASSCAHTHTHIMKSWIGWSGCFSPQGSHENECNQEYTDVKNMVVTTLYNKVKCSPDLETLEMLVFGSLWQSKSIWGASACSWQRGFWAFPLPQAVFQMNEYLFNRCNRGLDSFCMLDGTS